MVHQQYLLVVGHDGRVRGGSAAGGHPTLSEGTVRPLVCRMRMCTQIVGVCVYVAQLILQD